jgi:Na+/H+ antiporter NhaD/arsenite permease-like protein
VSKKAPSPTSRSEPVRWPSSTAREVLIYEVLIYEVLIYGVRIWAACWARPGSQPRSSQSGWTRRQQAPRLPRDWSPFVLVAGLLLVGLVADYDGLFSAAGRWMALVSPNGAVLYLGSVLLVALVTALLNLDTSVAFLTPVLVYAARSRRQERRRGP